MNDLKKHIVLKVENLSIGYQSKKKYKIVAENINFQLFKGELIGLIGANGIGKSTLLKTLTKFQNSINGSVFINDNNLEDIPAVSLAKKMSVVLTENIAQSNLTVQELIALGRQPYTNWIGKLTDEDIYKTKYAIESVKINDLADKKIFELRDRKSVV